MFLKLKSNFLLIHTNAIIPKKEFAPQKLNKLSLINARKSLPVYWIWENDQIKRLMFNPLVKKTANSN